jgi:hypothetical protein
VVTGSTGGHPLVPSLQLAVAVEMLTVRQRMQVLTGDGQEAELAAWREQAVDVIASEGDNLLYRGPRRGDTAKVFAVVAKALAVLAVLVPGGVDFAGVHFCGDHGVCRDAADGTGSGS